MEFDLIDRGNDAGLTKQFGQMSNREVADSDRSCFALLLQFFKCAPALEPLRHRVVNQIQIDVVKLEPAQARFESALGTSMVAVPQFCGNKNFFSGNAARPHRSADAFLVAVQGRGVDMAITGFESSAQSRFAFSTGGDSPHTQAQLGNLSAVV